MHLQPIDIAIIVAYIILTIFIGFWISKKAKKNLDSYFLGGKTMPWYMLGLSNASGMFDITGTMWTVAIVFIYGIKSVFIPWMWPVWNQIFLMMFLATWMRRSNVLTGAEWLKTRFGKSTGYTLSHLSVVAFALIATIGFIAYAFEGIGKFAATFLIWDLSTEFMGLSLSSENMYALIIMGITTFYVIKGGMYSVVLTEVLQFVIMTISCFAIGIIAMQSVTPEQIAAVLPEGWNSFGLPSMITLDWSGYIPELEQKIATDGYQMLRAFVMMMIFRGILVSIAGPVPGYDMQRVLACKTAKEASLMSGTVSLVLYFPRYFMITGLAILGLVYFDADKMMTSEGIDFEMILPFALDNYIPTGVLGLVLAGLIAAFMSTFAANVNAGPAYIVNDIYKKYLNPKASDKKLVSLSYWSSIGVVAVGLFLGFFVSNVDSIIQWLTGALFGGYAAANFLKWIWWRFNGHGYFWGMASGIVASIVIPFVLPNVSAIYAFPVVLLFSTLGSVIGCLVTKAEDDEILESFYSSVKPWGFWKPVIKKIQAKNPDFVPNNELGKDAFNSFIGIIWQTSMILSAMYLVLREYTQMWIWVTVFVITTVTLKFSWYDRIRE